MKVSKPIFATFSGIYRRSCKEYKEFRSSGVQEFRSSGVQEFRSSGVADGKQNEVFKQIRTYEYNELRYPDFDRAWQSACS